MRQFIAEVIADRGGIDNLSTIERGLIARLGELEIFASLLAAFLAEHGLTTVKGRARSAYTTWLQTIDRWQRLAEKIGIERKPKAAGSTLADMLRARSEAQR